MISSSEVHEIFLDCLFTPEEVAGGTPEKFIEVEGVQHTFCFHPKRVKSHRKRIREILKELPDAFHRDMGGGWSFLKACMTKDGIQWGEQMSVNELMCLGIAIGVISYCLPRHLWNVLPGSMPYFVVEL